VARDVEPDHAAFQQVGNAVRDRVLDERLQQQGRHPALCRRGVHVALDLQALAEPDLLDAEKLIGEGKLVGERDPIAHADRERVAEKIRQEDAHPPCAGGVDRRQRADRIQAVVEEMRIELRAQRAQFGVARHDFELQLPPLGLPGEFEREQQVMHRQRQQKQQHAGGEQQRLVACVLLGSRTDGGDGAEQSQPGARQTDPQTAGDHRRHRGGRKHTRRAARRQRHGTADVPRGETHERVDEADRQEQQQRGQPRHVLSRQDRGEQHRHDEPGGEIRRQSFHARENRVHAIRVSS
jgi:hypothetical protein